MGLEWSTWNNQNVLANYSYLKIYIINKVVLSCSLITKQQNKSRYNAFVALLLLGTDANEQILNSLLMLREDDLLEYLILR